MKWLTLVSTHCALLTQTGDESGEEKHVLNLSKQKLKKVPKQDDAHSIRQLILDENELQKIDNIDSYLKIETVSCNVLRKEQVPN